MTGSFGARLKAQRESRQVTLEAIAEQTKIRVGLLEALERDDVSRWPVGLFRRSFLRSYATAIGFDPEAAVREFVTLYPEAVEEPAAAILADAESIRTGRPRMRLHYLLDSAVRAVSKPFDKSQPDRLDSAIASDTVAPTDSRSDVAGNIGHETTVDRPADRVDLAAVAHLCTCIVEAASASDLEALLGEAARILHAGGIIVWPWDSGRGVLVPSLSHGYPRGMLARLPTVLPEADNPVGAAFRSSARQVIAGGESATGAIVVPLTTPRGCIGVLAVECSNGVEQDAAVQALTTVLAAQLSLPVQQFLAEATSQHAIA